MLLLHGWGDRAATFERLTAHFEAKYTCVSVDLPGFGASEPPHEAWSLGDYARFVHHFLDKAKLSSVSVLVGHSNGGAIALKAVQTGEMTVEKLVLLASSGIRPKKTIKTSIITVGAKVGGVLTRLLPRSQQRELRVKVYNKLGSDFLAVPHMAETFKKVVREDVSADLSRVKVPVLLVNGADDTDVPLWIGKKFQHLLPHATLTVVSGTGHFVHIDALDQTATAIQEFLQ